ncbi:alpha/beta-type small acid-soluble spore protein [Paenibacillus sp. IITD108]|uniref:alpha/beta-type small acid-soluble spore protein n=1 Tax=Paenibacillus sp. IITD108 TaxID=3116649 RepID=UPI002F3E70E5
MARSNKIVIPEARASLNQMKYEIAQEFGLMPAEAAPGSADTEFAGELGAISGAPKVPQWSSMTTRQTGSIGGEMTRRLVQQAEQLGFQL